MKFINFVQRQKQLLQLFNLKKDTTLLESTLEIRHCRFESGYSFRGHTNPDEYRTKDASITENRSFSYPVFFHRGVSKANEVIVLLHGLNERNWDKSLCWAEYLATNTGKAVLLFPIAYHMNRAPVQWSDPRSMTLLVKRRQSVVGQDRSLCFANVALSERLSEDPMRFYTSGRQTVEDLTDLARQIKAGDHPFFARDASIDFFAYSIGAFLSEITLMSNPERLFDRSRLFIFCGGAIFRYMFGESRCIMDKPAYDRLLEFYCSEWLNDPRGHGELVTGKRDETLDAFNTMLAPENERKRREGFFTALGNRLSGISLKKDKVMPYEGVEACMGSREAARHFTVTDFPYEYTHESPFPTNGRVDASLLNASFNQVFSRAALFLA
jgi:pimeloyl-ACP methyl ester carboxylesterase